MGGLVLLISAMRMNCAGAGSCGEFGYKTSFAKTAYTLTGISALTFTVDALGATFLDGIQDTLLWPIIGAVGALGLGMLITISCSKCIFSEDVRSKRNYCDPCSG